MHNPRAFLSQLNINVIRLGLGPISRLLTSLGNPHRTFPSVLIGGTNGKGSIAATLASVLSASSLKTGLYTSPHLVDIRERIRIDGEMISDGELDNLIDEVARSVKEEITYFEFLTALAFLYFQRKKIDIAVLEVGLGGRLDATNVVSPLVAIISNISLEHQRLLGRRLTEIAREKGGIIKEGGILITGARQKKVLSLLREICEEKGAKLLRLGKEFRIRPEPDGTFTFFSQYGKMTSLSTPLVGRHQKENAALALAAAEILRERGFPINEESIREGLKKTRWEGRLEVLRSSPLLVVDGGHNPAGMTALVDTLKRDFTYRHLILIFGALDDKNYSSMLKKILPLTSFTIVTEPDTPRAVPASCLAETASRLHPFVEVSPKPGEALNRALAMANPDDLILATGSLYLVGEIKKIFGKSTG